MNNSTLIILAGGKSSRMGTDKGLIKHKGEYITKLLINENASYFSNVLISSNNNEYKMFSYDVIPDRIEQLGPIGGVISCLEKSKTNLNVIISCDSPLIKFKILNQLLIKSKENNSDIVYSKYKNTIHPFPGCFNKRIFNDLDSMVLKGKRKMLSLEEIFHVDYVDFSAEKKDLFLNLNYPDDLKKIK